MVCPIGCTHNGNNVHEDSEARKTFASEQLKEVEYDWIIE